MVYNESHAFVGVVSWSAGLVLTSVGRPSNIVRRQQGTTRRSIRVKWREVTGGKMEMRRHAPVIR